MLPGLVVALHDAGQAVVGEGVPGRAGAVLGPRQVRVEQPLDEVVFQAAAARRRAQNLHADPFVGDQAVEPVAHGPFDGHVAVGDAGHRLAVVLGEGTVDVAVTLQIFGTDRIPVGRHLLPDEGNRSSGASSIARDAARASFAVRNARATRASSWCSSLRAIDMGPPVVRAGEYYDTSFRVAKTCGGRAVSRKREPERAAVRIARKLVGEIRRRRLRPGTQLAPEHLMVEAFGVARGTVREALRFLELQGALRIKAGPGGGPVVSTPGADHLASVLSLHLQFADASYRSVVEARCSIYPVLAAEAADAASREDLAALHASVARLNTAVPDADSFRDEARHLMNAIASASGNRVLAILVEALHRMSGETVVWDEKQRRSALRSYERVVSAIEEGRADDAHDAMAKSLNAALRSWERTAPDELKQPVAWLDADR